MPVEKSQTASSSRARPNERRQAVCGDLQSGIFNVQYALCISQLQILTSDTPHVNLGSCSPFRPIRLQQW
jgi:hypothetical protein